MVPQACIVVRAESTRVDRREQRPDLERLKAVKVCEAERVNSCRMREDEMQTHDVRTGAWPLHRAARQRGRARRRERAGRAATETSRHACLRMSERYLSFEPRLSLISKNNARSGSILLLSPSIVGRAGFISHACSTSACVGGITSVPVQTDASRGAEVTCGSGGRERAASRRCVRESQGFGR